MQCIQLVCNNSKSILTGGITNEIKNDSKDYQNSQRHLC